MNLAIFSDDLTASTQEECALQRALCMAGIGSVRRVLELCAGPSLPTFERAYAHHGISVTGNDIDSRWQRSYPGGKWLMGDALTVPLAGFDAVVFAPPMSRGCTGRREDSLMVWEVEPGYLDFVARLGSFKGIVVLVLPGRALATRDDRTQFYELQARLPVPSCPVTLRAGHKGIAKYHDLYLDLR